MPWLSEPASVLGFKVSAKVSFVSLLSDAAIRSGQNWKMVV